MPIRYVPVLTKTHCEELAKARLFYPGRLFEDIYFSDFVNEYHVSATISKEDGVPNGVCIFVKNYLFGWYGPGAEGIIGVYVAPDHRNKGLGTKLLERFLERNELTKAGHTDDLNYVARKIKTEKLLELR